MTDLEYENEQLRNQVSALNGVLVVLMGERRNYNRLVRNLLDSGIITNKLDIISKEEVKLAT